MAKKPSEAEKTLNKWVLIISVGGVLVAISFLIVISLISNSGGGTIDATPFGQGRPEYVGLSQIETIQIDGYGTEIISANWSPIQSIGNFSVFGPGNELILDNGMMLSEGSVIRVSSVQSGTITQIVRGSGVGRATVTINWDNAR